MYNKLFTKILDSSIWLESTPTRIVWLTFIAVMDEDGFCQFASVANVAHRARVTHEEAEDAIQCLENPDADSSDPANEGRRIERVPGGWLVLNAEKHRHMVTRAIIQEQTRERVRRHREKKRISNASVTPSDSDVHSDTRVPKIKNVSSGAENPPPSEPAILTFPIVGSKNGLTWNLTKSQTTEWRTLYPTLDVLGECRKALAWVKASPERRKTSRGMLRFLVGWLGRSQNRSARATAESTAATQAEIAKFEHWLRSLGRCGHDPSCETRAGCLTRFVRYHRGLTED